MVPGGRGRSGRLQRRSGPRGGFSLGYGPASYTGRHTSTARFLGVPRCIGSGLAAPSRRPCTPP
eukprot:177235-Lingulodinium_polyedra.AAC.1